MNFNYLQTKAGTTLLGLALALVVVPASANSSLLHLRYSEASQNELINLKQLAQEDSVVRIRCWDKEMKYPFALSIVVERIKSFGQIKEIVWSRELSKWLKFDGLSENAVPTSAAVHLEKNKLNFTVSYENGLMWPTSFDVSMNRKNIRSPWISQVLVSGDEGEYLRINLRYLCEIINQ